VIDQIRILRCYYEIKKVSGYVFPKLSNKDGKCMNKTIVTRVDVQWEGLEFRVSFVHLPKLGVAEDVCKVFHHQWGTMKQGWLDTTTCESHFVRLSPEGLEQIQAIVGSNSCRGKSHPNSQLSPGMISFTTRYNQRKLVFVKSSMHFGMPPSPSFLLYSQLIQFVYLEDALFLSRHQSAET